MTIGNRILIVANRITIACRQIQMNMEAFGV